VSERTQRWPNHIVVVRHGESERNIHKEIAERTGELVYGGKVRDVDVPLTQRGRLQGVRHWQSFGERFRVRPDICIAISSYTADSGPPE
jgi:broad specificity phosphatase PhoE